MKKVLAVASAGGHYVQLSRIVKKLVLPDSGNLLMVTTKVSGIGQVSNAAYTIDDISRDDLHKLPKTLLGVWKILRHERPDLLVSTGALPGLLFIILGRFLGIKTIWIDSIANSCRLSLSGRIASIFAEVVLTQWPHLAKGKILYKGSVI